MDVRQLSDDVFFLFLFFFVSVFFVFFFFQAEDGIRDIGVTGVQTCALPISINFRVRILIGNYTLYYTVLYCHVAE